MCLPDFLGHHIKMNTELIRKSLQKSLDKLIALKSRLLVEEARKPISKSISSLQRILDGKF